MLVRGHAPKFDRTEVDVKLVRSPPAVALYAGAVVSLRVELVDEKIKRPGCARVARWLGCAVYSTGAVTSTIKAVAVDMMLGDVESAPGGMVCDMFAGDRGVCDN